MDGEVSSTGTTRVYLGLGANLGDPAATIRAACEQIAALPGTQLADAASLYRTSPVGFLDQPDFYNTVIAIDTTMDAPVLLAALRGIERALGRKERPRWHEREIDIDILEFGNTEHAWSDVVIPHPRMADRRFVLVPFSEIAPDVVPAGWLGSIADTLANCADPGTVVRAGTLLDLQS